MATFHWTRIESGKYRHGGWTLTYYDQPATHQLNWYLKHDTETEGTWYLRKGYATMALLTMLAKGWPA